MSGIRPKNIRLSSPYIRITRNYQESFDLSVEDPYFKIVGHIPKHNACDPQNEENCVSTMKITLNSRLLVMENIQQNSTWKIVEIKHNVVQAGVEIDNIPIKKAIGFI